MVRQTAMVMESCLRCVLDEIVNRKPNAQILPSHDSLNNVRLPFEELQDKIIIPSSKL